MNVQFAFRCIVHISPASTLSFPLSQCHSLSPFSAHTAGAGKLLYSGINQYSCIFFQMLNIVLTFCCLLQHMQLLFLWPPALSSACLCLRSLAVIFFYFLLSHIVRECLASVGFSLDWVTDFFVNSN